MSQKDLKERTKEFALRIIKLIKALPNDVSGKTIANQLIRSGTSVGANYRAACRGRSKAEFIAKLGIVLEEADECCYWLELIMESEMINRKKVSELYKETNELTAIFCTMLKSSKRNSDKRILTS